MTSFPVIAIVDDDAELRDALGRLLRSSDYATLLFASGQQILASDQLARIDCVVTDIQMPGMSGFALHEGLRQRGLAMPVIFITAFAQDGYAQRARAAGAACFLLKPFQDTEILRCIRAALDAG